MTQREQKIVELRELGLTSDEIGAEVSLTGARIREILRDLGLGQVKRSLEQRFLGLVTKTENCWLWTGSLDHHGYGWFNLGHGRFQGYRKVSRAHRISYRLFVNPNCPPTAHILHSCDNPKCVNPAHLREGTPADNKLDCELRERGNHKLSHRQVLEIRSLIAWGNSNKAIAVRYGVHRSTIERIRNGKKWKFVQEAPPSVGGQLKLL